MFGGAQIFNLNQTCRFKKKKKENETDKPKEWAWSTFEAVCLSSLHSPQQLRCPGLWRCVYCRGGTTCKSMELTGKEVHSRHEPGNPNQKLFFPPTMTSMCIDTHIHNSFFHSGNAVLLTRHCVVDAWPVLTAVSFQPNSDGSEGKMSQHQIQSNVFV